MEEILLNVTPRWLKNKYVISWKGFKILLYLDFSNLKKIKSSFFQFFKIWKNIKPLFFSVFHGYRARPEPDTRARKVRPDPEPENLDFEARARARYPGPTFEFEPEPDT